MCGDTLAVSLSVVDDRPHMIMKYLSRHVRGQLRAACEDSPQAWKDLGRELMPDDDTASGTIAANALGNVINSCSSLFKVWFERQINASWRQLIEALNDAGLDTLATQIKKKLKPPIASGSSHTGTTTASQMPQGMYDTHILQDDDTHHVIYVCVIFHTL